MSRFGTSYPILNGPHGGDRVDAPPGTQPGAGVALAWAGPKGMQYAVYVLVEVPTELSKGPDGGPELTPVAPIPVDVQRPRELPRKLGLAFMRSWPTPQEAQQHVHEISLVSTVARQVAESN